MHSLYEMNLKIIDIVVSHAWVDGNEVGRYLRSLFGYIYEEKLKFVALLFIIVDYWRKIEERWSDVSSIFLLKICFLLLLSAMPIIVIFIIINKKYWKYYIFVHSDTD